MTDTNKTKETSKRGIIITSVKKIIIFTDKEILRVARKRISGTAVIIVKNE